MRLTMTAMGLALTFGLAAPALAQTATATTTAQAAASAPMCPATISDGARKSLVELQKAVESKNAAEIAAKDAAAQKAAKNKFDKCILAQLELKAAADAGNYAAASTAVEGLLASGAVDASQVGPMLLNLGKLRFTAKDYTGAASTFERAATLNPTSGEPLVLLGEAKAKAGQVDAGLALFGKAAEVEKAAGRTVPEAWIKRGVAMAVDANSAQVFPLSRSWVAAYPTPKNWRDTVRIYESNAGMAPGDLLDLYRLSRATKALATEADYTRYADALIVKGFPGEAAAVLNEGIAAKSLSPSSATVKRLLTEATAKSAGDRASLAASAKTALAAPAAKSAMSTADAYLGYGEYTKAAELYRAALTKTGVDASTAKLRLGIALALSGDKAGATTQFQAVTGPKAEIAKYWMTYAALRS